jgi:hypothetical protein
VIGCGEVLLVANNACMVVGHNAKHTPTLLQHLALDWSMPLSSPTAFANDISRLWTDFLFRDVVQLTRNKDDRTILVEGNACIRRNGSTGRDKRGTTYYRFSAIRPAALCLPRKPLYSDCSDGSTLLDLTQ